MEGLDLLINPKKTYDSGDDRDDDNYSSEDDNDPVHITEPPNLFGDVRSNHSEDEYVRHDHHHDSHAGSASSSDDEKSMTYEEIQREKQILLFKLERLERSMKTKIPRRFTMASNIEDIKYEYEKLKRQKDVDKSIKFQRKALMAITSGLEFLNNKFDPMDAKLDGWSESVMENINDYDEVFEELHEKYAEKIQMAPEVKLLMMVGGSAFMFHLTNTLFKSSVPGIDEILRQNPDIMRSISQAALNNMNNNMGGTQDRPDPLINMMSQGMNMRQQQQQQQQQQHHRPPPPPQNQGGGRMRGPDGVDDILEGLRNDGGGRKNFATSNRRRGQRFKSHGINIDT